MNLFKTLLISLFLISKIFTQDISGNFKASGISAVYYEFARHETSVIISDNYGLGINSIGDKYLQGDIIQYDYQLPVNEDFLLSAGVQLYVNFYEDGTAAIPPGSTYPTSITEDCISTLTSLPVTGDQGYSSNLNSGSTIPMFDIVGLPSKSIYAGKNSGSCSITSSPVFDVFPQTPEQVTIPFPINTASISDELGEFLPENTILPGQTSGYAIFDNKLVSTIEKNAAKRPSLYLEWHAIDGPINESGLGDIVGEDEDGDGTDYDRIFGLETIRVTKIIAGPNCGAFNFPISGQNISALQSIKEEQCIDGNLDNDCSSYAEDWINDCINYSYSSATGNDLSNLYAFDSNPTSSLWGGIITWTSINNISIDDSNIDFDESCLSGSDYSDCEGRLLFSYTPQCIPSISVRYFMAELTELCEVSEQDECGICGGDGPISWYNDADRDGLGDPNDFKTNCLPGYCVDNESLSYIECNDSNNNWEWLSMGICSDGTGTVYENLNPNMGDFEFCNYIMDNETPGYENATWVWDRGFSTNNLDWDDTCINIDEYHNCEGACFTDNDNDAICDEIDDCIEQTGVSQECGCNTGIPEDSCDCDGNVDIDCLGDCGGSAVIDNCDNCDTDLSNDCVQDCSGEWGGELVEDACGLCNGDNTTCSGCMDSESANFNPNATIDDGSCEYLSISLNEIPNELQIKGIYPNPFNPIVTISYGLPHLQYTEAQIYNLSGELVYTLTSQYLSAGNHSMKWNATGKPSGIYIFVIKTESEIKSQKLVLLK